MTPIEMAAIRNAKPASTARVKAKFDCSRAVTAASALLGLSLFLFCFSLRLRPIASALFLRLFGDLQIPRCVGIIGLQAQRLTILLDRLVGTAGAEVGGAQIVSRLGVVRIEF